jgi:4,5-DOPA dioxygenase extradiol
MSDQRMPAAFLGHGSPMNTLERNRYTEAWRAFGASVPRPRAILMVSAHWYINATAVTAMARPKTIHDFFGFPQADVPVVQLSINALKSADWHLALAAKLAPLRNRGVLVMGSGNVVHNLRAIDWQRPDAAFDWARRFDEHARQLMTERPGDVASLAIYGDFPKAAPTAEHFLPLVYLAGLAAEETAGARVLIDGYAYGSLSMTSYTVDAGPPPADTGLSGSAPLAAHVPADSTNA